MTQTRRFNNRGPGSAFAAETSDEWSMDGAFRVGAAAGAGAAVAVVAAAVTAVLLAILRGGARTVGVGTSEATDTSVVAREHSSHS